MTIPRFLARLFRRRARPAVVVLAVLETDQAVLYAVRAGVPLRLDRRKRT